MKLTLEALELLDAIEVAGSYAAAAQRLNRVPSAVTHAVRKLEADLGFPLYRRAGRRAVLTAAGRTLLDEGRLLLRTAGDLECRVHRVATGWEAELRIAVEAAIGPEKLLPLAAEFLAAAPGTRLRFSTEVLGGCWDALATGRADLAVGAAGEPPPNGPWVTHPLGRVEFAFALAPDHPLAALPEPLREEDVARYRVVALTDTSRALMARTAGLLSGQDMLTVDSVAAKFAALAAGLGVGHMPRAMVVAEVAAGRLVTRRLVSELPPMPLLLAWRSGQHGLALDWFVERLTSASGRARLQAAAGLAP